MELIPGRFSPALAGIAATACPQVAAVANTADFGADLVVAPGRTSARKGHAAAAEGSLYIC